MTLATNYYNAGTVSVGHNTTSVIGTGTSWLFVIRADDIFWINGVDCRVAAVIDNTHITLAYPWPGPDATASTYEIRVPPPSSDVTVGIRGVVESYLGGFVNAIESLSAANGDILQYESGWQNTPLATFMATLAPVLIFPTGGTSLPAINFGSTTGLSAATSTGPLLASVNGNRVGGFVSTGVAVRSSGAAHDLIFTTSEVTTADRTLSFVLNDANRTISLAGNLTTSGAFGLTLTQTGTTTVTLPTTGTLATLAGNETLTNKIFNAASNTVTNIATSMFATNVIDTDVTLAANADNRIASQKATKAYFDNALTGLQWKTACIVATTANITLSGEQTIDGVLTSASRVLVKNQSTASQNGIYVTGSGAWTRPTDMDAGSEFPSATILIESGTVNGHTQWTCTNAPTPTIGSTAITFAQVSGAGTYTAGQGITLSANQFSVANNAITYALLQQVAASSLVGNATGSLANATGITIGAALTFSGSSLQTVAMTGDVTTAANSFATTVAKIAGTTVTGTTGSGPVVFGTAPSITGGTISALTGLGIRNIGSGAFDISFVANGTMTAGRNLSYNLNDGNRTIALAGNINFNNDFSTAGTGTLTLTKTATTNVTLPITGTLATLAGAETLTNKTIDASNNTVSNLTTSMFAANVSDTDTTLSASSDFRFATQHAVKVYIDSQLLGLAWKTAVACISVANITLSGEQTIDGFTTSGSRVLVAGQTTQANNGIYVSAAGAWARAADAATGAEISWTTVLVEKGTTYADTIWSCPTTPITLGVTSIAFVQVAATSTSYTAGAGLILTGSQFSIDSSASISTSKLSLHGSGAASVSPLLFDGTVFTGGTGTTNFPHILIQPSGTTAATTWNTSGTGIGLNLAGGFGGNFIDAYKAGTFIFNISNQGQILTTGAFVSSLSAANSQAVLSLTGAINTAGTGTTNFPAILIQPTGTTAATTWSTAGTGFGMNLPSAFTGNLVDFRIGGAAKFSIDYTGVVTFGGGTATMSSSGALTLNSALNGNRITLSGAVNSTAWTTAGKGIAQASMTFTDTTSAGTVAAQYINAFKAPTIAASSASVFTNSYNAYFENPVAGTNVTQTNAWALGADSLVVGTSQGFTVSTAGGVTASGITSANGRFTVLGSRSQAAWGTSGVSSINTGATLTDSSSSGTVALQYAFAFKGVTIAASSPTVFTNSYNVYVEDPVAGSNVTQTNKYALGADSIFSAGNILAGNSIGLANTGQLFFGSRGLLTSAGAGQIQIGAADAASPVSQILGIQNVVTGTSNTAGSQFTIRSSAGTGTGVGGNIVFQYAPHGSTGSTPNAWANALTINGDTAAATFVGNITAPIVGPANGGQLRFWGSGTAMQNPSDGVITFLNNAGTSFSRLQLGGTTASFASLGFVGTHLASFLADGSAYAGMEANKFYVNGVGSAGVGTSLLKNPSTGVLSFRLGDDSGDAAITAGAATFSGGLSALSPTPGTNVSGTDWAYTGSLSVGAAVPGNFIFNTGFRGQSTNSTVTITNATPGVITWTAHHLPVGQVIRFTTTGTLPTGLALLTDYYVSATGLTVNTFQVSATAGGASIATSSAGSGTHTATCQTSIQNAAVSTMIVGASSYGGSDAGTGLQLNQTWDTTGNPTGLNVNITDVTSGATATPVVVNVNGSQVFSVGKTGAIASAGGITFSGGSLFNAYNEGTFTPTDGSGASLTLTGVNFFYRRIGNTYRYWGELTYPSNASGATAALNGFPFTAKNNGFAVAAYYTEVLFTNGNFGGDTDHRFINMNSNATTAGFRNHGGTASINSDFSTWRMYISASTPI